MNKEGQGQQLWRRAKEIIPGGSQLLSKRGELFAPELWPSYYDRAEGVSVWDLDGQEFKDFSLMGVGANILGYADPEVNAAAEDALRRSSMCTLNAPEEVVLAQTLVELHPWSDMVRFARTGGEAMAIAVRIARAATGKSRVAFCGYHGWHDWYLATNLSDANGLTDHLLPGLEPKGVPEQLRGSALPFQYNHIEELEEILKQHDDVGVIVIEPLRHQEPVDGFLERAREIATRAGAVLVFDEITAGWRMVVGGVHLLYGVEPDIAVFGKAMANGFAMSAVVGRRQVMQAAQETFISSTFWTERIGPAAALATIETLTSRGVPAHLKEIGVLIGDGWKMLAKKHGIDLTVMVPPALVTFSFNYGGQSQAIRTLFTQEMLRRGYLASSSVYVSFAHSRTVVEEYLVAVDEVFDVLSRAIAEGAVEKLLEGPVAHSGFQRLT